MNSDRQDHHVIDVTPEPAADELSLPGRGPAGRGLSRALLGFAVILLGAVGAALYAAYDYWQEARHELLELNEQLVTAKTEQERLLSAIVDTRLVLDTQQGRLEQQERALDQQAAIIATQEDRIQTQQKALADERLSLQKAREALIERLREASQSIEGDPDRWLIAEATALLRTAGHRLATVGDREGALRALKRADELLARAGKAWQPAREVLGEEISRIEAYTPPDVRDIADQLLALNRRSREIPLKTALLPPAPPPPSPGPDREAGAAESWRDALQSSLTSLRSLVTVHRTEPAVLPTLTAPYRAYLRQHVWLALDSARIGALSRDAAMYRSSITTAVDLLNEFYAPGPARDEVTAALKGLSDAPLELPPPVIGRTLSLLESLPQQKASR